MADLTTALRQAKAYAADRSDIRAVYLGYRYVAGEKTAQQAVVFAVEKKQPRDQLREEDVIPSAFDGVLTDVVEGVFTAYSLTGRRRPCPAGFSIGHVRITAGTFGLPVRVGASDEWWVLTNNHVAADSNAGSPGDRILQPGKADNGQDPADWWASLTEFVAINFDGAQPKKSQAVGRAWWGLVKGVGNTGAWLARCPFRVHVSPFSIGQPTPNLVDAAVCKPREQSVVLPEIHQLGPVMGVRDLQLGDRVVKVGRTTELTRGVVEGVQGYFKVSYGTGSTATFDDQLAIRGDTGDFSAGGDSGSAILSEDGFVGGLLFAGGGGQTIANKFSHVQALLGVRP
jgi:hypothetical protein